MNHLGVRRWRFCAGAAVPTFPGAGDVAFASLRSRLVCSIATIAQRQWQAVYADSGEPRLLLARSWLRSSTTPTGTLMGFSLNFRSCLYCLTDNAVAEARTVVSAQPRHAA